MMHDGRSTQFTPTMFTGDCNSQPVTFSSASVHHAEGGWPKVGTEDTIEFLNSCSDASLYPRVQEVDCKQQDQVTRFIKKIEKSDQFMDSVLKFSTLSEEKVKQNVAVEIYEDYFDQEDEETNIEDDMFAVKTIISYPDPSRKPGKPNRPVGEYLSTALHTYYYATVRLAASASAPSAGTTWPSPTAPRASWRRPPGPRPPAATSSTSATRPGTSTAWTARPPSPASATTRATRPCWPGAATAARWSAGTPGQPAPPLVTPTPACPQDQPDDDSAPGGQSHGAGVLQQVDSLQDGDGDDDQQRGRRGQVVGCQEAGGSPHPARPRQHRPPVRGAGEAKP